MRAVHDDQQIDYNSRPYGKKAMPLVHVTSSIKNGVFLLSVTGIYLRAKNHSSVS